MLAKLCINPSLHEAACGFRRVRPAAVDEHVVDGVSGGGALEHETALAAEVPRGYVITS